MSDRRERPSPELRHLASQKDIRSAPNADRVQACVAQVLPHRCEDLFFVSQVAVGQQDDGANMIGSLWFRHQVNERRQHFGAAARLQTMYITPGRSYVLRRRL